MGTWCTHEQFVSIRFETSGREQFSPLRVDALRSIWRRENQVNLAVNHSGHCWIQRYSHQSIQIAMIRGQRRVIKTPVKQIVWCGIDVPFVDVQVGGDLHPVSLSLVIAKHRRFGFAFDWKQENCISSFVSNRVIIWQSDYCRSNGHRCWSGQWTHQTHLNTKIWTLPILWKSWRELKESKNYPFSSI